MPPPRCPAASIACWNAFVSSVLPSPRAPVERTLDTVACAVVGDVATQPASQGDTEIAQRKFRRVIVMLPPCVVSDGHDAAATHAQPGGSTDAQPVRTGDPHRNAARQAHTHRDTATCMTPAPSIRGA
jgi:hypothetical protein